MCRRAFGKKRWPCRAAVVGAEVVVVVVALAVVVAAVVAAVVPLLNKSAKKSLGPLG